MPRFTVGQTAADFEFRWRHWQTEVVARIDEGDYATSPQLGFIAKILAGDEATFKVRITDNFDFPQLHLMMALLTNIREK